jgi:DNA-binding XRE family transcriptional regulator
MDVMEPRRQALDQREVEKAFLVFKQLPQKKRERVLKLIELLNSAECQDECLGVVKAIAEIIAKASGLVAPGGRPVDLSLGVSKNAKDTVAAYHGEIGKAIRKRREELKMTQEGLARKSGLPQSHISRLEAGKHAPTRQTIETVAEALKIEPGKLDLLYD